MNKEKLAVIICATNLVQAHEVCENIKNTSGVECEFFIHDNNFFKWSLAKTYNTYAKLAKAPNLLLCHQDIKFVGTNWGKQILKKLSDKKTGVIGFAGSVIKLKDCYSGWALNCELSRNNYCYKSEKNKIYISKETPFDKIAVIDGLAMFVSKRNAIFHPFDEVLLTGFHCYDIDFSMQLMLAGFNNYVYTSKDCTIIHDSPGNYNREWALETKKLTDNKWNVLLPIQVEEVDKEKIKQIKKIKDEEFDLILNGRNKEHPKSGQNTNDYEVRFNKCSIYSTWV